MKIEEDQDPYRIEDCDMDEPGDRLLDKNHDMQHRIEDLMSIPFAAFNIH